MADMGRDFEAPKQSDVKLWKVVELLTQHGIKLAGGYDLAGLKDLEAFLPTRMTGSEGERLLRKIRQRMGRGGRST
jgi:hypothetical protein